MILMHRNDWKPLIYLGGEPPLSVKSQIVNIWFCEPCGVCGNYSKTKINEHDCGPVKSLFAKGAVKFGQEAVGSSLLTLALYHNNFRSLEFNIFPIQTTTSDATDDHGNPQGQRHKNPCPKSSNSALIHWDLCLRFYISTSNWDDLMWAAFMGSYCKDPRSIEAWCSWQVAETWLEKQNWLFFKNPVRSWIDILCVPACRMFQHPDSKVLEPLMPQHLILPV